MIFNLAETKLVSNIVVAINVHKLTNGQSAATPLHLAADNDHPLICKVLLAAGADVNATDLVSMKRAHPFDTIHICW